MTCLRRYLRHKPAGLGTYGLVVETLTLCAQGRIASVQMLTSLRNILCKHPQVLRALTSLLTRVHAATNSVRCPAYAACVPCSFATSLDGREHHAYASACACQFAAESNCAPCRAPARLR